VQTNTTLWNKHKYQGLGLVLDVEAGSDNRKCGLKYVIYTSSRLVGSLDINDLITLLTEMGRWWLCPCCDANKSSRVSRCL